MASSALRGAAPVLVFVLAGALGACGDGGGGSARDARACPSSSSSTSTPPSVPAPTLPDGIPWPGGVVATAVARDAKQVTVDGYAGGSLAEVATRFRSAFAGRSLVTLEADEEGDDRATYTVAGPSTQGTLTLTAVCERVDVRRQ